MKKLTLDLEKLEVRSFPTAERVEEEGTVKAHGWSDVLHLPHDDAERTPQLLLTRMTPE